MAWINGKKTYILAVLGVIYALAGLATSNLDSNTALQVIGASLGFAFVRHGISTSQL